MTDADVVFGVNLAANQLLVNNLVQTITVDSVKTDLLVTSSNASLSNIIVPSTVTSAELNYSAIVQTSGISKTVQICTGLTINKDLNGDIITDVQTTIPPCIIITGSSTWKGIVNLPQAISTTPLPIEPGKVNTISKSIEIGFGSTMLTSNKAVRIVFVGDAGKRVSYFNSVTPLTDITTTCSDNTQITNDGLPAGGNCKINVGSDLIVWTKHFTGFATWSSSSSGSSAPTSSPSSSASGGLGGAAGATGVGPSGPTSSGAQGFGGILTPALKIYQVSYDFCKTDMVRIVIGTDPGAHPTVILRTLSGIIQAQLSSEQPFAEQNVNATIQKAVYEAHIDPREKSFEVVVLEAMGKNVNTIGKTIEVTGCKATIVFEQGVSETQPTQIDLTAPKIFDVRFQVGNGTKVPSSDVTNQYVDNQPLAVYSIIDSPTPIDRAELRFVKLGDDLAKYTAIKMNVNPLLVSNTTYVISGTIPKEMMQAPAISYWIHVENHAGKESDSDKYAIGVKPNYSPNGKLEFDILPTRAEGTTATPTAYFTNSGNPVFGTISLVADGNTVYTSPVQLFGSGQTPVNLKWKTPTVGQLVNHHVIAIAEFYGKSFETDAASVITFPGTITMSILQSSNIDIIKENNKTVANPSVLYSSFKNDGNMRYRVTAPDGTCVIGASDNCLVTQSTQELKGNFKSITIGDQIYRVRYSGPSSSLERFSITSVDPIVGHWNVEIDSQDGLVPQAHAMQDVFLKVKYRAQETAFITGTSK
jgi:hypothetical protein